MIAPSETTPVCTKAPTDSATTSAKEEGKTETTPNNAKTEAVPKIGATKGTLRTRSLRYMPPGVHQYPSAFQQLNRPVLLINQMKQMRQTDPETEIKTK